MKITIDVPDWVIESLGKLEEIAAKIESGVERSEERRLDEERSEIEIEITEEFARLIKGASNESVH